MKIIQLTQGKTTLIDDADYEFVSAHKWYAQRQYKKDIWYARGRAGTKNPRSLHFFLTGYRLTDHKNTDTLDNRRENLREATYSQNAANRGPDRGMKHSRFKGVTLLKKSGKWQAQADSKYLGSFDSEEEAARAYDAAAKEKFGEFARINFPVTA